jgi:DDE superfamily endonuclease
MNLQVIASPSGDVLWVSGALPGSVHDKKAEWIWGVLHELEAAGLVTLADKGYLGSTWAKIPYRGKGKARIAERGQPRPREAPRPRREGKRPAQELADPP